VSEGALQYRKPLDVAVVESEGGAGLPGPVYLSKLPGGKVLVLEGTASVIWRVMQATPADEVVGRVAADLGVDEELIRPDVVDFIDDLVARGLVEIHRG
jgi:hypothetical protein